MTYTTKDGVTIPLDIPEGEKKETRYSQPSFVRACRNNERIASVLDYFIYAAGKEGKGCKVVKVARTHKQILQGINNPPSRKSLIRYLDSLNEWKLVFSQQYQREFTVDLEAIQEALLNPPQAEPRSQRLHEKGGHITTLQPFEKVDTLQPVNVEELLQKVDKLQQKVDTLQPESGQVTTFCGQVTTLQRDFDALKGLVQRLLSSPLIITSNILPINTNNNAVAMSNNVSSLLTEEDYQAIDKLMTECSLPHQGSDSSVQNTMLPAIRDANPQHLNAKIETYVQEVNEMLPTQDETPRNESEQQIGALPPNEEETQSASYSPNMATKNQGKRERKNNKSNKVIDLKASEIALPQKPDPLTHPYDVELFIELGDYYRGSKLPVNHREGTKYMQAYEAAKTAVAKKLPFEKVDEVFAMLKDRGVEIGMPWLNDPDWNYPADLWVVINNFDYKIKRVNQLKKQHEGFPSSQDANGNIRQFPQTAPQERPSVLVSSEARARNLARLQAKVAAAQAQAQ